MVTYYNAVMEVTFPNITNKKKELLKCLTNCKLFGLLGWLGVAMIFLVCWMLYSTLRSRKIGLRNRLADF